MNTQIGYAPPNAEVEHPTLGDLIRAVEKLSREAFNGTEATFRKSALAAASIGEHLEHMTGYVDAGEVYETAPATAYDRALGDLFEIAQHDIRQGNASTALTVAVRNVSEASR
ncbi:hypothetical protein [Promicromonospora iranensis]|uniref:Excreted virulence factor EspC (Type VII ESX diderm) n=1 Tax=Promicromonospora iranensis TaxID=1105144 RepID=A0ABU2CVD0_9MICO|nr:hypothetical protein [Promicromonospora iranensis]MDR7385246.1 hypothetical protein [Promicromonospora iranensis]